MGEANLGFALGREGFDEFGDADQFVAAGAAAGDGDADVIEAVFLLADAHVICVENARG